MLFAVISDVHANLEALNEVLKDIKERKVKNIFFIGDAVGYGPNPNECVALLNKACKVLLAGNHDWAVTGLTEIESFNPYAKAAIRWTDEVLTEESRRSIEGFKLIKNLQKEGILLVHSTPWETEEWHYLLSYEDAERCFRDYRQWICFVAHSHMPFILERLPSGKMQKYKDKAILGKENRYVVNAGSVGQPRDRDPRACYALMDGESVELIRVEYPIEETQRKMREAGLPKSLIERLAYGV
jgi:predicted phosphodiesterase